MIFHTLRIDPFRKTPLNQSPINKLLNNDKLFYIPNCLNQEDDIILYKLYTIKFINILRLPFQNLFTLLKCYLQNYLQIIYHFLHSLGYHYHYYCDYYHYHYYFN